MSRRKRHMTGAADADRTLPGTTKRLTPSPVSPESHSSRSAVEPPNSSEWLRHRIATSCPMATSDRPCCDPYLKRKSQTIRMRTSTAKTSRGSDDGGIVPSERRSLAADCRCRVRRRRHGALLHEPLRLHDRRRDADRPVRRDSARRCDRPQMQDPESFLHLLRSRHRGGGLRRAWGDVHQRPVSACDHLCGRSQVRRGLEAPADDRRATRRDRLRRGGAGRPAHRRGRARRRRRGRHPGRPRRGHRQRQSRPRASAAGAALAEAWEGGRTAGVRSTICRRRPSECPRAAETAARRSRASAPRAAPIVSKLWLLLENRALYCSPPRSMSYSRTPSAIACSTAWAVTMKPSEYAARAGSLPPWYRDSTPLNRKP